MHDASVLSTLKGDAQKVYARSDFSLNNCLAMYRANNTTAGEIKENPAVLFQRKKIDARFLYKT